MPSWRFRVSDALFLLLVSGCVGDVDLRSGAPAPPISPPPPAGDGRDGPLVVSTAGTVVNVCHAVGAIDGASLAVTSTAGFEPGGLVLVAQMQDDFVPEGGPTESLHVAGLAGRWEIAIVSQVGSGLLELATPPAFAFAPVLPRTVQVCTFPQFASVTVTSAGTPVSSPWDGSAGGVLAFAVQGELVVDGLLSAKEGAFEGAPRPTPT